MGSLDKFANKDVYTDEERDVLIRDHLSFAFGYARNFHFKSRGKIDVSDLEEIALHGLLVASRNFIDGNFQSYLVQIMRNDFFTEIRSRNKRVRSFAYGKVKHQLHPSDLSDHPNHREYQASNSVHIDGLLYLIPDHYSPDPSVRVEVNEEYNRIMGLLDADDRDLLSKAYIDGDSFSDIAKELGIADGTVSSRIHRIKQHLLGLSRRERARTL